MLEKRDNELKTRHANVSFHGSQMMSFMRDLIRKLEFQHGNFSWEVMQEELVEHNGITLMITLYVNKEPILPLHHKYEIEDTGKALQEAWREHFKKFVNFVNSKDGLSKFTRRLVAINTERKTIDTTDKDNRRLDK